MMTAEQLKSSILQLAMQGKLVEQRPEEGTGEELFKKILVEKKKLIKEGKIKKKKDLLPITEESAPFEIPETWKWTNLGEIIDYRMGKTPPRAETVYWGKDFFWVSIADMVDGKIITETKEKISHKAFVERFNNQISPKGTLIMSFKLTVGRVSILGMDAVHNEAIISIFPFINTDDVLRDYLKTMLPFLSVYGESKKAIKGFTLNSTSLNNIPVPLPPLAEQKRIVAKIEALMPFVEQYAAASTKLNTLNASFPEMMKKSILQEAVQGKLVPQDPNDEPASLLLKKIAEEKKRLIKEGKIKKQKPLPEITEDEIPFDIPENWEWARWGIISESIQYGYNAPALESGRIKMVRISDIQNNSVKWDTVPYCDIKEDIISEYLLKENDILFARTGGTVGKSFLVKGVDENAIYAGYLIRTRYSHNLCPEYLKYFMESDLYWRQLRNGTIATAQPNCNGQTLSKMLIPIPPLKEQYRIANKLKAVLIHTEDLK